MRYFLIGRLGVFGALALCAAPGALTGALAAQDTPASINGVETVCTGVGSAKDDPRWKEYPIKIVLATVDGDDLANAHVALARGGQTLAETDCDAPWVLVKAPPGKYTATATLIGGSGQSHSASFTIGRGGQKDVNILFRTPASPAIASTAPAPITH